jgi:hypothetical protein
MLTLTLSLLMLFAGLGVIVEAIAGVSSVAPLRLFIGVLLVAAGVGRMWVEFQRGRGT